MEADKKQIMFPRFALLPAELQIIIWRLSLPGPRTLCLYQIVNSPNKLIFPAAHYTPNPAALSTCRTSRNVAVERYRLVFGTPNVYADLPGGDILYFGPWNSILDLAGFWNCLPMQPRRSPHPPMTWFGLSKEVMADLDEVTHVALHSEHLTSYISRAHTNIRRRLRRRPNQAPNSLRLRLRPFKGLKKVSLVCAGSDVKDYCDIAGQVIIRNTTPFQGLKCGPVWDQWPQKYCVDLIDTFKDNPSEEEIRDGMPEIQLAAAFRIMDTDGRTRRPPGEIYVSCYPLAQNFKKMPFYNSVRSIHQSLSKYSS